MQDGRRGVAGCRAGDAAMERFARGHPNRVTVFTYVDSDRQGGGCAGADVSRITGGAGGRGK